jgi:hypothetical protein
MLFRHRTSHDCFPRGKIWNGNGCRKPTWKGIRELSMQVALPTTRHHALHPSKRPVGVLLPVRSTNGTSEMGLPRLIDLPRALYGGFRTLPAMQMWLQNSLTRIRELNSSQTPPYHGSDNPLPEPRHCLLDLHHPPTLCYSWDTKRNAP